MYESIILKNLITVAKLLFLLNAIFAERNWIIALTITPPVRNNTRRTHAWRHFFLPPFFNSGSSSSTNFKSVGFASFTKWFTTTYFLAFTISRDCVENFRIQDPLGLSLVAIIPSLWLPRKEQVVTKRQ